MPTAVSWLPDLYSLTAGLTQVLHGADAGTRSVTVLARQPNPYASRSRSEIVTCRLANGDELRLFCKYENRDRQSWSDVAYEAEVYRRVLRPCRISALMYHGAYTEPVRS